MPQKKTSLQLNKKTWSCLSHNQLVENLISLGFDSLTELNKTMQSKKRLLRSKVTIWLNGTLPLQALSLMTIWTQILDSLPLLTAQAICTEGSARILGLNDLFAMTRDQDKMLMRHSSFLTSYAMSLMGEIE